MEFQFEDYLVRITLNPVDIIVRFEHNTTFRAYEQTFFERDFPEASLLGGLEFLGKALTSAFQKQKPGELTIEDLKISNAVISFNLVLNHPLFATAIVFPIELHALRKDSGNVDMNVLNRKVKDLSEGLEPRIQKLQEALESRLSVIDILSLRLKEVEERAGNHIVIPGCMFAIPILTPTLILVRDRSSLPTGETFSIMNPGMKTTGHHSSHHNQSMNWNQPFGYWNGNGFQNQNWEPHPYSYAVLQGVNNLSNLKFLKQCTQLTLSGLNEVQDYSPIGEMRQLTHLSIVNSRQFQWFNNAATYASQGNHPTLRDISWVKNLKNLQSLTLLGCSSLSDITPLKDLPNLKELDIRETMVRNTDFLVNANLKITK